MFRVEAVIKLLVEEWGGKRQKTEVQRNKTSQEEDREYETQQEHELDNKQMRQRSH